MACRPLPPPPRRALHRRHRAGRHPLRPQRRPALARSTCRKRWARAARSSMPMATAGPTSCSSTARTWTPHGRSIAPPRSIATTTTARSPTSPRAAGWTSRCTGMGVAVGDYDNDGRDDVYITALDGDHLFHNEGNGKFRDVTKAAGIHNAEFRRQRRVAGLRPRRQARPVRRQLRAVDARRATCGARSTAPPNPTARRNPTRARARACTTTWAAGGSKT